jgi:hypothetical protein
MQFAGATRRAKLLIAQAGRFNQGGHHQQIKRFALSQPVSLIKS